MQKNSANLIKVILLTIKALLVTFPLYALDLSKDQIDVKSHSIFDPPKILKDIENVANWQLRNPVRFDIIFRKAGNEESERFRMHWDGTLMLRHNRPFSTQYPGCPESWSEFGSLNSQDVSFCELPPMVKDSLLQNDIGASDILEIKMEDQSSKGWEQGALFAGLYALSKISEDPVYYNALMNICQANEWKLGPRIYHADDHCVGQIYLDLYKRHKEIEMMANVQMQFDWIMKHPVKQGLKVEEGKSRWTWCDALFMSPPVWCKLSSLTDNSDYIDYMDKEWWATSDYLYDKKEHLFYRDDRYFDLREANGEKLFWSRGNGWVIAGLARILEDMPEDYPTRERYEKLFREMAARIADLQPEGGLWHPSLLDIESYPYPETSSSGFFCYALSWGLNHHLLSQEIYLPVIKNAWKGLSDCIQPDGRIGWVQLPGSAPDEVQAKNTTSYGVGAYLLAGSELYKFFVEK